MRNAAATMKLRKAKNKTKPPCANTSPDYRESTQWMKKKGRILAKYIIKATEPKAVTHHTPESLATKLLGYHVRISANIKTRKTGIPRSQHKLRANWSGGADITKLRIKSLGKRL